MTFNPNWSIARTQVERAIDYVKQLASSGGGGGGGAVTSVFGRTGAVLPASGDYTFAQIGSKPTTLGGYGITDAYTQAQSDARYQPLDTDLSAIAGLTAADGDILIRSGGAWTRLPKATDGQVLTLATGLPSWATPAGGGSGTVTSVGLSSTDLTVSGSPITTSGTITANLNNVGTAGTYGTVTTDAKGRVTSGAKGWETIAVATLAASAATLIDTGATAFANYDVIRIFIDVTGYSGSDTIALTLNALTTGHQYFWATQTAVATSGSAVTWTAAANQATNSGSIKLAPANSTFARGIEIIIHNRPEATEKIVEVRSVTGTNSTGTAPARDICGAAVITGASTRVTRIKLAAAGGANLLAGTSCIIEGRNAA